MRNETVIILSASDASSQSGMQVDTNQILCASFQAVFGDATAVGTVKIQASNDIYNSGYTPGSFAVTNWSDIPSASATITAGGIALIPKTDLCYRWIRAVYTSSSGGSSTVNITMNALGI